MREQEFAAFFRAVIEQNREALRCFFTEDAEIFWHCSNERFTAEEYLRVNCDYPGRWGGEVERLEIADGRIVSAARVWDTDSGASFHAVSFLSLRNGRIARMDEYWADDDAAPVWRRELRLGRPIR